MWVYVGAPKMGTLVLSPLSYGGLIDCKTHASSCGLLCRVWLL